MSYTIFKLPKAVALDTSATVLPGAKLYFHLTGTTTPVDTYTTSALNVAHANPVVADIAGVFPVIYLDPDVTYKVTYTTAADVLLYTVDPVNDDLSLTQEEIGAILYQRTQAEIAAGVTPTYYYYEPGDVRRYGAVLDGVTSDHVAFQASNSQSAAGGSPIFIPATISGMATSAALTVSAAAQMNSEPGAWIKYIGSSDVTALLVGQADAPMIDKRVILPRVTRATQSTWSSESNIGIRLMNLQRCCSVIIPEVNGFTIGLQLIGQSMGCYSNRVAIGNIINNKVAVDFTNDDDTGLGYCNSNTLLDGYLTNDTSVNPTVDRYGIRFNSIASSPYYNNGNKCHDQTFELNTAGSGIARAVLVSYGTLNLLDGARDELNDPPFMRCENLSEDNYAYVVYGSALVENDGTYANNFVRYQRNGVVEESPAGWTSNAVHKKVVEYDGGGSVYCPGMAMMASTSGTIERALNNISISSSGLTFAANRAIGRFVDVRRGSGEERARLVLRRDVDAANGGRWLVVCFDDSGAILPSNTATVYAASGSGTPLQATTDYGNAYQTGGDSNGPLIVWFHNDVKTAFIAVSGGTGNAILRSISVANPDMGGVATMQGITVSGVPTAYMDDDNYYATAAPATGGLGIYYLDGQRIRRVPAAAASSPGWVVTTPGLIGAAVFSAEANNA